MRARAMRTPSLAQHAQTHNMSRKIVAKGKNKALQDSFRCRHAIVNVVSTCVRFQRDTQDDLQIRSYGVAKV